MYNVRIYIVDAYFIFSRLQSYDIFSNVVSQTYGKYSNEEKLESTENQSIKQNKSKAPMENFGLEYGMIAECGVFKHKLKHSLLLFGHVGDRYLCAMVIL